LLHGAVIEGAAPVTGWHLRLASSGEMMMLRGCHVIACVTTQRYFY
jgi:hypothetical protein